MTHRDDDRNAQDEPLAELVPRALRDQLLPTTEAEVARAEREGVEFEGELPESLRELPWPAGASMDVASTAREDEETPDSVGPDSAFDPDDVPESLDVVPISRGRRKVAPWLTHVAAAALGAAAVATLVLGRGPTPTTPAGAGSQQPSSAAPVDAAPAPERTAVIAPPPPCGDGCCAGAACKRATPDLAQCPSGRDCVACSLQDLATTRFRVRVGALAPANAGREGIDRSPAGALHLCVHAGASAEACVPVHPAGGGSEPWTQLPILISAQDLLSTLSLQVKPHAAGRAVAQWQSPVPVSATVLCKGLSVKLKTPGDAVFGSVSLFLEDAHYVEAARSAGVAELDAVRARISAPHLAPKVFETRRGGDRHFALVYGPMGKGDAEKLRWQLLEAGIDARVTLGEDHEGDPRP